MVKGFAKKMKQISVVMLVVMLMLQSPLTTWAMDGYMRVEYESTTDTKNASMDAVQNDGITVDTSALCGYIDTDEVVPPISSGEDNFNRGTHQTYYRNVNIPAIRNQNPYGTCWAFSIVACMEINLMKKGINLDLSELQLVHNAYNNTTVDSLGGTKGDSYVFNDSTYNILTRGGNSMYATNALSKGLGITTEAAVPYSSASDVVANGLSSDYAFDNNVAYLKNSICFNMTDTELAKDYILNYGAIAISYYYDSYYENGAAYYCDEENRTNHGVTVIGWDDNYSKDNFNTQPEGDGAWIVRNSWGTWYGESGYFYMSYYDKSLSDSAYAVEATLTDAYDNKYQYDGGFGAMTANNLYGVKQIYKAKGNKSRDEKITAVMLNVDATNNEGILKISTGLKNEYDADGGTVVHTQNIKLDKTGWITYELTNPVVVSAGECFMIEIIPQSDYIRVAYEMAYGGNWIDCKIGVNTDKSYYKYAEEYPYYSVQTGDMCVKVLTENLSEDGEFDTSKLKLVDSGKCDDYISWEKYDNGLIWFTELTKSADTQYGYRLENLVTQYQIPINGAKYIYWDVTASKDVSNLFDGKKIGTSELLELRFGDKFIDSSTNITNISGMFINNVKLKELDLSNLDLTNLESVTADVFDSSLHILKTPIKVAADINLDIKKNVNDKETVVWMEYAKEITSEGTTYTKIPMNNSSSFTLVRTDNHDMVVNKEESIAVTCEKDGKTIETCQTCAGTKTTIHKAKGHIALEEVEENVVEPTYTQPGSYELVAYCGVCGKELSRTKYTIPMLETGWTKIDGKWYYLDKTGEKHKGWLNDAGKWYYLGSDGVMLTGWLKEGSKWYYLDGSGAMKTKWQYIGKKWYYFDGSGAMKTDWQYIGKKWYYFDGSGAMKTDWQYIGKKWYYFDGNGAMKTKWQYIGSEWYYFDGSGAMKTGWQYIGKKWYYFYKGGNMAHDTWIGNDYVDSDGVWTKSR